MRDIICIDLKSFFASVECIERNLDPFKTPLVVCNPERHDSITLAVTPYLKKLGVEGRTRVYNLPKNIKIIKVPPRMKLYKEKSKEVIKIYLEFIEASDMHIYSIDEVFLDVTNYLHLYKCNVDELALKIINRIKEKTGLTTTAGIGPNLLLAKVSMDIEAKHVKNNIAHWEYKDIKTKLWNITPLHKMWGIGLRLEKRLNNLGIYSIKDLALYNKNTLKNKFGIIGEELWNHANGIDNSKISEFNQESKNKSYGHSQVLYKDYNGDNIKLKQVLYSLLMNAVKKTENGFIEFNINTIEKYDVCRVIFTITDSGIGIGIDKINEILSTTSELNKQDIINLEKAEFNIELCQKIIKSLGGNLLIKSKLGKGTEIILTIDQKIYREKEENIFKYENLNTNKKVLIVNQDKDINNIIKRIFNENDINTSYLLYGKDAIDRIKSGKKYDYIIIEDDMKEISGYETLKGLKNINKFNTPCIVMLNNNKEQIKEHYIKDGFSDYIMINDLKNELKRIIDKY